ncbi:MAG: hypothetical protein D6738_03600 [Acidobacteria bacterium]|nr:MAG: hypothetical protein D6738_03600 [Acidobacteriota bacterium]
MSASTHRLPRLACVIVVGLFAHALAGEAPGACRSVCEMRSDILVFAQGDPDFEINAKILECFSCTPSGGTYIVTGRAEVEFGPYTQCDPATDVVTISLGGTRLTDGLPGGPSGGEPTYVMWNPLEQLVGGHGASGELRTQCVDAGDLDYRVPQTIFSGQDGATTPSKGSPDEAYLALPDSVRYSESSDSSVNIGFDTMRVPQDLRLDFTVANDLAAVQRFWPDGFPLRMAPESTRYRHDQVTLNFGTTQGFDPYEPAPPDTTLGAVVVESCPTLGTSPPINCTGSATISNMGYFDETLWEPGTTTFDLNGLTTTLSLPAGTTVTYETHYPRGIWLSLDSPAEVTIVDGRIREGSFAGGHVWLHQDRVFDCGNSQTWKWALNEQASRPQIGPDGSVMAGVTDLAQDLDANPNPRIDWTFNQAGRLGCGTIFAPSFHTEALPQTAWYQSAVPTVRGRGIYAGVNYNRNRVCQAADSSFTDRFCIDDGDCDTVSGETCVDGGFSPLCPDDLSPLNPPIWYTQINGNAKSFSIHPQTGDDIDREMVFVVRRSGVTGVFDGGDTPFTIPGPPLDMSFDRYGVAFKISTNELADSITEGSVLFDWPADETLPFQDLSQCTCGKPMSADAPDVLIEKRLLYWSAEFRPYGLDFFSFPNPAPPAGESPCPVTGAGGDGMCGSAAQADAVCVAGLTPVPHIEPEFDADFYIKGDGQSGGIKPMVVNRTGFDRHDGVAEPWTYDLELFELNDWSQAGSPSKASVEGGSARWGYYHSFGEILLPYFGLTRAGIRVERKQGGLFHFAYMHEEGFPDSPSQTYFWAERKLAGDSLNPRFKVDYYRPSLTRDLTEDSDITGAGQGTLFAHADPSTLDLGSVQVAGALLMHPGQIATGDIGPAGALRLWGYAQHARPEAQQALTDLMGASRAGYGGYQAAMDKLLADPRANAPWDLPPSDGAMRDALFATGAAADLAAHEDAVGTYNVSGDGTPPMNASAVTGHLAFSGGFDNIDFFQVGANIDTNGEFFALDSSMLSVDRHVMQDEEPIQTFTRAETPGDSDVVALPAEQTIPFPSSPFMSWVLDYSVTTSPAPKFTFNSLTGTMDLTKGGLSGLGFDEMGATLKFYSDATWYFDAGLKLSYQGFSVNGVVLLGATADIKPLKNRDPTVASFLDVDKFYGGYARLGFSYPIIPGGCVFNVKAGADVAGWHINGGFGGKTRGWLSGKGGCIVTIKGDLTLIGADVNDLFKLAGSFWVGGGIGFCDEDGWNTPADAHDDDFCAVCTGEVGISGTYPPDDLNIKVKGPKVKCSL